MKYSVLGFNQCEAVKFGLDLNDLMLLRYFIDFKDTGLMISEIIENKTYYWLNYENIIKEIPMLKLKKDSIYRRFKNMCSLGVLEHETIKKNGTYSYYAISKGYSQLISDTKPHSDTNPEGYGNKSVGGTDTNPEGYGNKSVEGTDLNPEQKINLLNNKSTKDSSIKKISNVKKDEKQEYSKEFESFWSLYPRQQEEHKAFSCWVARIKEKVNPEDMIKAAENYKKYCNDNVSEDKFIKLPSTFLGKTKPYIDYIDWQPQPQDVQKKQHNTGWNYKREKPKPGASKNERQYNASELEEALLKRQQYGG